MKIEKLNRRQFLAYSGAATGGLILGGQIAAFANAEESDVFFPNVWLQIAEDGQITVWVKRVEMGQGTRSSLAMVAADELGANWEDIKVRHVSTDSEDWGYIIVGGSGGLSSGYDLYREMAAQAREMLLAAAAVKAGGSKDDYNTENSFVIHSTTGQTWPFASLVEMAARMPKPQKAPLKDRSEHKLIGKKDVKRKEHTDIVGGTAEYGIDVVLPGMRYATIIRPPHFGARPRADMLAAFREQPGVEAAFLLDEKPYPQIPVVRGGIAIVASSTWAAQKARANVEVEWVLQDQNEFSSDGIFAKMDKALAGKGDVVRQVGNWEAGLEQADEILEAEYQLPFLAHAPIEPMNAVAVFREGKLEVWTPTQAQTPMQQRLATHFGMPEKDVVVHCPLLGGSFGRRLDQDYAFEAAMIAHKVSYPVRLLWTREDDMQFGSYRSASKHKMKATIRNGGLSGCAIKGSHIGVWSQFEPHMMNGPIDWSAISAAVSWPYGVDHLSVSQHLVREDVMVGWWRGVYATNYKLVQECWIDEIALHLGKDPVEFRLSMLQRQPDVVMIPDHPDYGDKEMDIRRFERLIEFARDTAGWKERKRAGKILGFGSDYYSVRTPVAVIAEVSNRDGRVSIDRVDCFIDCGIAVNPDAIAAQFEGGVLWALSSLTSEITFENGQVQQSNFDGFQVPRMDVRPKEVNVHIMPSDVYPSGVGEPAVTATMPALANAISALKGERQRIFPIDLDVA
ncbi:MAG: xanthine dehydrogenase family protein molybdopterin-binding subunit [Alphaproteobacteria bacterium]|nr:xanthine dehydrogenase family protein molybdopterin-binding subunit [Alphaproteobacteria bacterium]